MKNDGNKFTVGGLFSGVGGIELGFKEAGFKISWCNDNDKNAYQTFKLNSGRDKKSFIGPTGVENLINDPNYRNRLSSVDVLVAGFPCQPFSLAGYRSGINECPGCHESSLTRESIDGKEDFWECENQCGFETSTDIGEIQEVISRGNTFYRVMEIVDIVSPEVIFLENVKNFSTHDNGNTIRVVEKEFTDRGYSFTWKVLNTSDYTNIPQNRERIFMVGFKNESKYTEFKKYPLEHQNDNEEFKRSRLFDETLIRKIEKKKSFYDIVEKDFSYDKNIKYFYGDSFMNGNPDHINELKSNIKKTSTFYQWRRVYVRENKNNLCPTLMANMGTGGHNVPLILTEEGKIRKLTPKECFKLQGFKNIKLPDISDAQLYKQAGNSVTVPLIKKLAKSIKKVLEIN